MKIRIYKFDENGDQVSRDTVEADSPEDALDPLTDEPVERQTIDGRKQAMTMAGDFLAVEVADV